MNIPIFIFPPIAPRCWITRWVLFVKQTRVRFPLLYVELLGIRNLLLVPCPVQEYFMVKWKKKGALSLCEARRRTKDRVNLHERVNTFKSFRDIIPSLSSLDDFCDYLRTLAGLVKPLSRVRLFATPRTVACTRLLRPWDFLSKSTGVGCHFLLQGIFLT